MKRYNPTEIEKKWQDKWEADGTYVTDLGDTTRPKYYSLSMLPGITGAGIHIGHGRTFQFADIKARLKRQQGYNTYHPIGWDSFGLPVENYAIKVGKTPRVAHDEAKAHFIAQLKRLGFSYDWSKEISTADPEYYKWTQWIFTQLYKHDLAYQKEQPQWWCDTDNTVLANEQVEGGKCWRCGNPVTKRNLKQWFFRITAYADEILEATDDLDWTDMVKTMQKNWIGRSVGAEVEFVVEGRDDVITVFTTRPDTLFGATYVALAPEHPLVSQLVNADTRAKVEAYIQAAQKKSDVERQENKDKTGVFTGSYAINPVNGQKLPIWVADYILGGYGTGAIMAVPAHDERDLEFAEKFDLPVVQVIEKPENSADAGCYTGEGELINSGDFDGLRSEEAREQVVAWLEQQGLGRSKTTYKMRDWLISRQRYWGAPIPMVHVDGFNPIAVADECLPVILPEVGNFKPTGGNTSVLAQVDDWVRVWVDVETGKTVPITEPKPAGDNWHEGRRETDTLDGYACSSWYFLRYLDPHNDAEAWNPTRINHWMPVDYYNGADHAVAHLLYSRFWMRFFYKLGLVPTPEPFKRMMYNAYIMAPDGQKMSKSKGNVIDPMEIMDSGYGADALRVYEMFIAPYDMDAPWDPRGVPGTYRFLNRVWNVVQEFVEAVTLPPLTEAVKCSRIADASAERSREISSGDLSEECTLAEDGDVAAELLRLTHLTIKKVTRDIEDEKFNTAVAAMMEMVNGLYKFKESHGMQASEAWQFALESLLQILAPFAPHITEELWHELGHADTIHVNHWPKWDEKYLVSDVMTIIVQVNGKLRSRLELPADADKETIEQRALDDEKVRAYLDARTPKKVIYVPGKLVNIVV
ncbi:leucine--tRNA ligase [Candidatus Saccharibacteria bacterium oral taxon 488]|nr:leucine--tRNA ligase [Candidatus Saccharibacteria bacterium oral taxon 488]QJU10238.1 leucine--tRNA ligase [Candidatus Saccharibacteria bacterium oral taxon 488]